ncbi:lipid phosphate phosphohydrolase 1 isoform X2 [Brachionus plicatilis]|uniref:Lipid phosphate phosphohydrolase 1 isoform X2 n=1 Tax=Brachionus plicatilis TaxID=10195 RepID=A0A3M7PHY0_BRAPC|nr:lipid phosphate phosphohydrolase 1 isoform X2 [Brachionus plicatilis]
MTTLSINRERIFPDQDSSTQMEKLQITESKSDSNNSNLFNRVIQIIIDLVAIIIVFIAFLLVYLLMKPYVGFFYCNDTDIFYPYRKDTVEIWVVSVYGVLGPIIFMVFTELKNSKIIGFRRANSTTNNRSKIRVFFICFFHAMSLFLLGIAITLLLTEIGKRWIGRLRPHFIDVCKPDLSKLNCTTNTISGLIYNRIYTGNGFCTGEEKDVNEARLSFPSGHSSFSCYTMAFLMLYIEARLRLLRFRHVKALIQLLAFIAAFITCISRISDYHHRGSDVIGGAVLGVFVAILAGKVAGRVLWTYNVGNKRCEFES